MHKKGVSVFTIDAVLAVTVITVGIAMVFLQIGSFSPVTEPSYNLGQNVVDLLSNTRMEDLGIAYDSGCQVGQTLSNTVFDQVGEFYAIGASNCASFLLAAVIPRIAGANANVEVLLHDQAITVSLYNPPIQKPQSQATILIPFKKIIYGTVGIDQFWTYIIEVRAWQ